MKRIIDEELLEEIRSIGRCEVCGSHRGLQAHHVLGKGRKSERRYDVRINLLCACLECHTAYHYQGHVRGKRKEDLEQIVADREGVRVEWLRGEMNLLRRGVAHNEVKRYE